MPPSSFLEILSTSAKNPVATLHQLGRIRGVLQRGEVAFALGLIAVLVVLVLPLPRAFLDMSLAISLAFSVLILMTVLFIEKPLDFNSFPTVLLVATMMRLSLNVASTRLILSDGHEGLHAAGEVIRAFGYFVMGGNFVIGMIVFGILVIINFIVITKGSGRIAEVSARFSLDALPGKQMAVDADLTSGAIDQSEARRRREIIQNETNFYGAMDGAAKFVRGDAIAGLMITFINIIGGIIIGVVQKGLTFSEASHTYTFLTVGDGLVTQIPALIVSVAAGMLVSKTGADGSADKALFGQLSAYPTALGMSAVLMTIMAVLPGIPAIPFLVLALATGTVSWKLKEQQLSAQRESSKQDAVLQTTSTHAEDLLGAALQIESIKLELGYGLLEILNDDKLTNKIKNIRREIASQMGFVVPSVRVLDNTQLEPNQYRIRIKDIEIAKGTLRPQMLLVLDPKGHTIHCAGEDTKDPVFGLDAKWIYPTSRADAEMEGYTVVEPGTVLATHLTEILKDSMGELLSFSDVQKLVDRLEKPHQKLFSDLVPTQLQPAMFQRILQNLLAERVSIRDLGTIIEGVGEAVSSTRNPLALTEHVRSRIGRQICASYETTDGILQVISLSAAWERTFQDALSGDGEIKHFIVPPSKLQEFVEKMNAAFQAYTQRSDMVVLLTSGTLRPYVRSIVERFRPLTPVISQHEIHPKIKLKTIGEI
ncbi:MAG: flagellar biosynthesis protein FlhA [Alphaproteobacteria bacterium]